MELVHGGHEDPVDRLRKFRAAHPEVDIMSPLDTRSAWWKAFLDGRQLAVEHELALLMDDLEKLEDQL
jgi:hypothetical protein